MSRRGGTWTGWQDGKAWQEAGVIGTMLDFTDDDIITQQTIEHTKSVIGRCRAMDAAVAYELASAGQDGAVSVNDLITDRTKAAYLIETRRVGYGVFRDPTVESCGHDELSTTRVRFTVVNTAKRINDVVFLEVRNTWGSKLDRHKLENYTSVLTQEQIDMLASDTISSEELIEAYHTYIKAKFGITDDVDFVFSRNPIASANNYNGECAWKGQSVDVVDEETGEITTKNKICSHHDGARITGWAMLQSEPDGTTIEDYKELFLAGRCARRWNQNQLRDQSVDSSSWVTWESKKRSLIRGVNERELKKLINKSLARMLKRNDNVVSKEGLRSSAVYSWSDWDWLADVTSYIRQTRSKNRKAGDVLNGWEFTAVNKRWSYGMEISDFVWTPSDSSDTKYYTFNINYERNASYSWNRLQCSIASTTIRIYLSEDEAREAGTKVLAVLNESGIGLRRVYVEGEFEPQHDYTLHTEEGYCSFTMEGSMEPEEYLSPAEITRLALTAAPNVVLQHKPNFREWTTPVYSKVIAKEIITEGEEVEAE